MYEDFLGCEPLWRVWNEFIYPVLHAFLLAEFVRIGSRYQLGQRRLSGVQPIGHFVRRRSVLVAVVGAEDEPIADRFHVADQLVQALGALLKLGLQVHCVQKLGVQFSTGIDRL